MYIFKEVISIINRTIGTFCFGFAMRDLFTGKYKNAAWILFVVSVLFMVGYFAEQWSK